MSNEPDSLGACPECEAEINPFQVLIEYEKADGTRGRFAECGSCGAVVQPD